MASFSSIEPVGGTSWKFTPSGTAPFDYYLRGKLVIRQSSATYIIYDNPGNTTGEPPALEVVDANDTALPDTVELPGYLVIQWEQVDEAEYYTVERYESSAWVEKAFIREQGLGYYKHVTDTIPDESAEQWRVVATDSEGNDSTALTIAFTMISYPDPPDIELSYALDGGTGTITVSEA